MVNSYFIVSKPLQYINALNIPSRGKRSLILVDGFINARDFYQNVAKLNFWDKISFCNTTRDAYLFLTQNVSREDFVFIDSDYGLIKMYLLSRIRTSNIFVYEEGEGSYRNNLLKRTNKNVIFNNILRLLGVKEHFGGSKFVKGIYVYDHQKFINNVSTFSNRLFHFKNNFIDNLDIYRHHFHFQNSEIDKIISSIPETTRINIYLTTYYYNMSIEKYVHEYDTEFWMIKPHPQIAFNINPLFQVNISPSIFMELLILRFVNERYNFRVYHEGSSTLQYFSNVNQVLIGKIL